MKKVVKFYNKADVTIDMIHADNEFRAIAEEMEDDFDVEFNFAAPDEHVPDIERENRTLQERFRAEYHRLPFKILPKKMIRALIARCTKNRNLFVQEGGCSEYYSPHMMLSRRHIDFEKHLKYSFGSYGIASHENKPQKNDPRPRGLDVIYLRPLSDLQGGHEVLHLASGRVINRPKFTPVVMTEMVIKRVEQMAKEQGLKSCKFFDRKRNLLLPDDLQEEVGGYLTMYLLLKTKMC